MCVCVCVYTHTVARVSLLYVTLDLGLWAGWAGGRAGARARGGAAGAGAGAAACSAGMQPLRLVHASGIVTALTPSSASLACSQCFNF